MSPQQIVYQFENVGWRIREIVGDWWPYQGGEGFDGCVG